MPGKEIVASFFSIFIAFSPLFLHQLIPLFSFKTLFFFNKLFFSSETLKPHHRDVSKEIAENVNDGGM